MQDFAGKVAVVTGGASGMGFAMAQRFAEAGMNIVLADIEAEPLAMAEAAIRSKGADVLAQRTDVARREDLEALADAAYKKFGKVHILVNNAGVGGSPGASWELSEDDWRWVIDVDLWSVINGIRAFVPRMIAGGEEGHIVSTASIAGLLSGAVGGPYTVAKFGVLALSEQIYFELGRAGHNIGVSVLCPGLVSTNIFDSGRNRQAEYGEPAVAPPPGSVGQLEALNQIRDQMIQPSEIAERVFQAVRERKLYVIVPGQDAVMTMIKARHDNVLEGRNPEITPAVMRRQ